MQSEWLIVAGCAGLLVNTVLLRYLLRVLGERRVLCIGTLPGQRTRMLPASPAQILSPSDNSCDPAVMAACLAVSAQLSKEEVTTGYQRLAMRSEGACVWCAGMAVSCVQQLCVAFAGTKYLSIAAVALGSVANISFPAISSIKSKSVPRHEQVSFLPVFPPL